MSATAEVIQPKFRIGDSVFGSFYETTQVKIQCPDCLGAGQWEVTSPAGEAFKMDCPTCCTGFVSTGCIIKHEIQRRIRPLTVGRVTYESRPMAEGPDQMGYRYMCQETGVGTGTVYYEDDINATVEEAEARAEQKAAEVRATMAATHARQREQRMKNMQRQLRANPCPHCEGTGKATRSI